MSHRPFLTFGALVAVVLLAGHLAFTKEGSEEAAAVPVEAADEEALQMFDANCGACHTLAAAGTDGVVGPDLDEVLPAAAPGGAEGSPEEVAEAGAEAYDIVYPRVMNAVTCGLGGRMPAGILQDDDAAEVSGFVAAYAGQLGKDQGPLVAAGERETPEAEPCSAGSPE